MDVTYTNVLEGARQYFQGLPAAAPTAITPGSRPPPPGAPLHYSNNNHHHHQQQQHPPTGSQPSATTSAQPPTINQQHPSTITYAAAPGNYNNHNSHNTTPHHHDAYNNHRATSSNNTTTTTNSSSIGAKQQTPGTNNSSTMSSYHHNNRHVAGNVTGEPPPIQQHGYESNNGAVAYNNYSNSNSAAYHELKTVKQQQQQSHQYHPDNNYYFNQKYNTSSYNNVAAAASTQSYTSTTSSSITTTTSTYTPTTMSSQQHYQYYQKYNNAAAKLNTQSSHLNYTNSSSHSNAGSHVSTGNHISTGNHNNTSSHGNTGNYGNTSNHSNASKHDSIGNHNNINNHGSTGNHSTISSHSNSDLNNSKPLPLPAKHQYSTGTIYQRSSEQYLPSTASSIKSNIEPRQHYYTNSSEPSSETTHSRYYKQQHQQVPVPPNQQSRNDLVVINGGTSTTHDAKYSTRAPPNGGSSSSTGTQKVSTDSRFVDNRQVIYDNRLVSTDTRSIPSDNRFANMRQGHDAVLVPKSSTNISLDYRIITSDAAAVPMNNGTSNSSRGYDTTGNIKVLKAMDNKQLLYDNSASLKIGVVPKQKRESPLDLSVKTVKTTADSTLDDSEESKRLYSYGSRYVESPQQRAWNNANIVPQDYTAKTSVRAPKVDFLPNFNMPSESSNTQYQRPPQQATYTDYNQPYNNNNYKPELPPQQPQQPRKRHVAPTTNSVVVPPKIKKQHHDAWRQTIDQQIDQRINSYNKGQVQPIAPQTSTAAQANYRCSPSVVPARNTQYGPHNIALYQTENQKRNYEQYLSENTKPGGHLSASSETQPPRTAATKKVLSLLRNSLQVKEQREAKKKLEQEQMKNYCYKQSSYSYPQQQPAVVPHVVVTPSSQQHNLPVRTVERPVYNRLAIPKAVESIKPALKEEATQQASNNDFDGLAAFLAARIRTKGELKQGTTITEQTSTNNNLLITKTNVESKPEFTANIIDLDQYRMLNSNESSTQDVVVANKIKSHHESGMRSSTETSVFDFPDSDNEIEMPVLERQSLLEMRKDRKSFCKQDNAPVIVEEIRAPSPLDLLFDQTCDNFLEQLKTGCPKKRGRRKKIVTLSPMKETKIDESLSVCDAVVKIEKVDNVNNDVVTDNSDVRTSNDNVDERTNNVFVGKENIVEIDNKDVDSEKVKTSTEIKKEIITSDETIIVVNKTIEDKVRSNSEPPKSPAKETISTKITVPLKTTKVTKSEVSVLLTPSEIKKEKLDISKYDSSSDSDVPLINCKFKLESSMRRKRKKLKQSSGKFSDSSCSDSELESTKISTSLKDTVTRNECKTKIKVEKDFISLSFYGKPGKKPLFGDGSHFHPGWEEELYKYKRSLRIPSMLIHVTQPTRCQRLSTSLPDLDPCPLSPAPSSITEQKMKIEPLDDTDLDSNCSYSFSLTKTNYDSEGSSSVKSLKSNISILDRLLEKCGGRKRRKYKKHEDSTPKLIPKSENSLELLPTPILETSLNKDNSVLLGFRKQTVENFKQAFIKSSGVNINQFSTVVLKSRTRTETRVLKEKATIREVFGEDRPQSAPPVTCLDELKSPDVNAEVKQLTTPKKNVQIKTELDSIDPKSIKAELKTDKAGVIELVTDKKRTRLRNIRRKFSSGFDYIRKKKKIIKREPSGVDSGLSPSAVEGDQGLQQQGGLGGSPFKVRPVGRRCNVNKATPESVEDIQKEIKMWVLNKGVGETHLHRAARLGYTDITAYCLEETKCFPSPKDNAGYTPLHEASSRGHLDIAKLLLLYGANVSESAQGGIRPLHEAAENGFVELIRLLLSYGADPSLATYAGQTPLSLATDDATIAILQSHLLALRGQTSAKSWEFRGPADFFDSKELGYDPLANIPDSDPAPLIRPDSDDDDVDDLFCEEIHIEVSEHLLPNLYALRHDQPTADRWVLLHDLSSVLKIKSKETLLRQLTSGNNPPSSSQSLSQPTVTMQQSKVSPLLRNNATIANSSGNNANNSSSGGNKSGNNANSSYSNKQSSSNSNNNSNKPGNNANSSYSNKQGSNGKPGNNNTSNKASNKQQSEGSSNNSTLTTLLEGNLVREMKMSEFLEQAHCCQFLNANERLQMRSNKVLLVRYTDKVRELLNVEKEVIGGVR